MLGGTPLRPLRALLQDHPPPPPHPPPLRPSHVNDIAAALRNPPKDIQGEEDFLDALIMDPLQELFGIQTSKGKLPLKLSNARHERQSATSPASRPH